ncbi:MAG: hypothetical protein WDO19_03055 [Bacteroidota bacterium]
MRKIFYLLLFILFFQLHSKGQVFGLLKDINPGTGNGAYNTGTFSVFLNGEYFSRQPMPREENCGKQMGLWQAL